jgi:hypothetical protein
MLGKGSRELLGECALLVFRQIGIWRDRVVTVFQGQGLQCRWAKVFEH